MGHLSTHAIEVDESKEVSALQAEVEKKFGITPENQIIKTKLGDDIQRMDPQRSLSSYELKEKSIIFLESNEIVKKASSSPFDIPSRFNSGNYLSKLGILNTIFEEDTVSPTGSQKTTKSRSPIPNRSMISEGSDDETANSKPVAQSKKSEELEEFLSLCKQGNLELIAEKIKKVNEDSTKPMNEEEKTVDTSKSIQIVPKEQKVKWLINENGHGGWNSLHYAIYYGHTGLVKLLLANGGDPQIKSNDDWTPLQLATYKENTEIVDLLLKEKTSNINMLTSKGSALHIAAKRGHIQILKHLLENGADINLKNSDEILPIEFALNDDVKKVFEQAENKRKEAEKLKIFVPPRPPKITGWLLQAGNFIFDMNKRFYSLDPDQGILTSYKTEEDYPHKPRKIVPLKEIIHVQRIEQGFFFSKKYFYFEVWYPKRAVLATYTEEKANEWVTYIYKAAVYCRFVEQLNKETMESEPTKEQQTTLEIVEKEREKPNETLQLIDKEIPERSKTNVPTTNTTANNARAENPRNARAQTTISPSLAISTVKDNKGLVNYKSFKILRLLGQGSFGSVYKVMKRDTGEIFAMKVLNKKKLIMHNQLKYAVTECNILKRADHPFILSLYYAFQTPENLYMVIDYCSGGDLALLLAKRERFSLEAAKFYMAELILAIEQLHNMDAIYRDLKPENILLCSDGHIKLADFGLAKENIVGQDSARSFCGTPAYLSPEMMFQKGAGKAADIYGLGVILYELLLGTPPYFTEDIDKLYARIKKGDLKLPSALKEPARSLVKSLLDRQPDNRIGVKDKNEIKNHPFFEGIDWDKLLRKEVTPPYLDELKKQDEEQLLMDNEPVLKDEDYTEANRTKTRVRNFTFIKGQPKPEEKKKEESKEEQKSQEPNKEHEKPKEEAATKEEKPINPTEEKSAHSAEEKLKENGQNEPEQKKISQE